MQPAPLVLVVDDDAEIRSTLGCLLELAGYRVATAPNGREALHAINQEVPALVFLDMNMPVLDGRGFARELARRGERLPIIVMTAEPNLDVCAREVGAVAAIGKPFSLQDLLTRVESALQVV
jgi:two-component system response regulator PrrA